MTTPPLPEPLTGITTGIHPSSVIDPSAIIEPNVTIGPFCMVGPNCIVGEGSVLTSHVVLEKNVRLGKNCQVSPGAVLGGAPQDYSFGGEQSYVEIGNHSQIREYVTINRATGEGQTTRIGQNCLIMSYSHIAHNCELGNEVVLANSVHVAGHVTIGDAVFVSGMCLLHQNIRIGRLSFICPFSGSRQDVPPFAMTNGRPHVVVVGTNKIGLRRKGFNLEQRTNVKKAYQYLLFSGLSVADAIVAIRQNIPADPNVEELITFFETSKRGISRTGHHTDAEAMHAGGLDEPLAEAAY